jgi:hypothetical protein
MPLAQQPPFWKKRFRNKVRKLEAEDPRTTGGS